MPDYISIKHLSEDDRPREKLLNKGRDSLSDAEILAILIGSGTREKSAVELCREILIDSNNNLNTLAKKTINDLMKFKGIGEAKAITIAAALELGRRRKSELKENKPSIKSSADAYHYIKHKLEDLFHEEFHVILLNRANKIIKDVLISKGGLSGTVADGKLIFKAAITQSAAAIILVHNHPSGNLTPSQSDKQLTLRMKEFGQMIDLPVLDHLIIGDGDYYSFADENQMS